MSALMEGMTVPALLVQALAVALPALIGGALAYALGHRQVRVLREKTGDDSVLTNVLSGEAFRRHDRSREHEAV
jgi:hypothetical protein